jgi:hypothetical protein
MKNFSNFLMLRHVEWTIKAAKILLIFSIFGARHAKTLLKHDEEKTLDVHIQNVKVLPKIHPKLLHFAQVLPKIYPKYIKGISYPLYGFQL